MVLAVASVIFASTLARQREVSGTIDIECQPSRYDDQASCFPAAGATSPATASTKRGFIEFCYKNETKKMGNPNSAPKPIILFHVGSGFECRESSLVR